MKEKEWRICGNDWVYCDCDCAKCNRPALIITDRTEVWERWKET